VFDVFNEKLEPRERAVKLANLVKALPPGVAPERLAGALQRIDRSKIGNLEEVIKALDPAVTPLVVRIVANAIGKMRATEVRKSVAIYFTFGLEGKAGNSEAIANAMNQVRQYRLSASEVLLNPAKPAAPHKSATPAKPKAPPPKIGIDI